MCGNKCANQPIKGIEKVGRRRRTGDSENVKRWTEEGDYSESGVRRRIFGDGLRSMGSARVGCQMLYVDGMLRRSGLGR